MKTLTKLILICFLLGLISEASAQASTFSPGFIKFKSGVKNFAKSSSGTSGKRSVSSAKPNVPNLSSWFKKGNKSFAISRGAGVNKMPPKSGNKNPAITSGLLHSIKWKNARK